MFSDSQLRPFVQEEIDIETEEYRFGCCCVAGATIISLAQEVVAFGELTEDPDIVVISVGTNNIANKHIPGRATRYAFQWNRTVYIYRERERERESFSVHLFFI